MLDTYQLQIFLAVMEAGSYTAAAQRLHLTQPAVSRQVHLLQEQLGVHLFRRVGRRMMPTHAGERLMEIARQVLGLSQRLEEELSLLRGEAAGVLRIGGSGAPAWHILGRLLPALRRQYPGIGVHLEPLPDMGIGRAVREGHLDIVVAEEEVHERGLVCDLLIGMETMLAVPPAEHWERRKRLPLRKLAEAPLILPASGTPARSFLEAFLAGRNIPLPSPVHALEVSDPGAALPLVAAGLGVALLPRPILETFPTHVRAVVLWPGFSWPLYLIRKSAQAGRLTEIFCSLALGEGRALLSH